MEILSGIGIGSIKYGITETELIELIGRPDKVDESEYILGSGEYHRILWYPNRNVHFTFDQSDNFRLGCITILGRGHKIFNRDIIGLPQSTVKSFLSKYTNEIPKYEEHIIWENEPHECLDYDKLGILLWFDFGNLTEMQCSYLFEQDCETEIWPK